jgi:hypothetical protein
MLKFLHMPFAAGKRRAEGLCLRALLMLEVEHSITWLDVDDNDYNSNFYCLF